MERAALVNKHHTRRSTPIKDDSRPETIVSVGTGVGNDDGFTDRVLMSLVLDISQLAENVEQIKVKVFTMAKARGIVPPQE